MKTHIQIGSLSIIKMFALFYPVCPIYFYIAGAPVRVLILVVTVLPLFLLTKGKVFLKKKKNQLVFPEIVIWSLVFSLLQLYHTEWALLVIQILLWIGLVWFGSSVINTKEKFIEVIDTIILGSVLVGGFGLVEEFTHFNIFSLLNTVGVELNYNPVRLGIFRIISFTSHSISYGCYCMIALALIIYRLSMEKKTILYVAGGLMLLNEFFALSRVAILGVFIEVFLFLWFSGYRRLIKTLFKSVLTIVIIAAILSFFSEKVRSAIEIASYVVLALFDDGYASILSGIGFTDNAGGIGNRFDLYRWVYEETKSKLLLGNGAYNLFQHRFVNSAGYWQTKSSIEVEWLRTFYRYGIIGVISEIYMYLMLLVHSLSKKLKIPAEWEGRLSFPRIFAALLIAYVLVMFGVMQNEEVQLFSMVVMLVIAYVKGKGFRKTVS